MTAMPTPTTSPVPTRVTALHKGDVITSHSLVDVVVNEYNEDEVEVRADFTTPHIDTLTIIRVSIYEDLGVDIIFQESDGLYNFDTDVTLDLIGGRATYRQLRETLDSIDERELDTIVDYDRLMELATVNTGNTAETSKQH